MNCKNCGTKLKDGALFCHSCGTKRDVQSNVEYTRVVIPEYTVYPKRPKKKKGILIAVAAVILIAAAAFAGVFLFGEKKGNLKKFDEENRNTISTSWFEEFAENKKEFGQYELSDSTETQNYYYGHAVLNQRAADINNNDYLDGIYLSTYENSDELNQYAYEDILEIMGKDVNTDLIKAIKSSSGNFYYFQFAGGMFGDHSYCFYLKGNSMVFAIQCLSNEKDAYDYLLEKDAAGAFGIPDYNSENSDLISFNEQFIEDYNNR